MYPSNTVANWIIQLAENNYIQIEFKDFHVESSLPECAQDSVEVYNMRRDGSTSMLGRYCQANLPPEILLSGMNQMTIVLRTDHEYSNSGFLAYYSKRQFTLPEDIASKLTTDGKNIIFILLAYISRVIILYLPLYFTN